MKEYLNFVDGSNFRATPIQNGDGKVCALVLCVQGSHLWTDKSTWRTIIPCKGTDITCCAPDNTHMHTPHTCTHMHTHHTHTTHMYTHVHTPHMYTHHTHMHTHHTHMHTHHTHTTHYTHTHTPQYPVISTLLGAILCIAIHLFVIARYPLSEVIGMASLHPSKSFDWSVSS